MIAVVVMRAADAPPPRSLAVTPSNPEYRAPLVPYSISRAPGPVSGQLYDEHPVGGSARALPLSCCLSATGVRLLGVLFPPGDPAPLTVGLPAAPKGASGPWRGSTFHTHEVRPGRASSLPRGDGVPTTIGVSVVAACRLTTAGPYHPVLLSDAGCQIDEASTRVQCRSPFRPSLACDTRSERAPLSFPLSFAPSRYQPRTSGRGQVWNTEPSHVVGVTPNLQSTNLLITCDIVSHRTLLPPTGHYVRDGRAAAIGALSYR
jgi:hypothetical protein